MANDILIKIGADITDFSRKMKESNQALKGFADANKETFDAFKKTGTLVTGVGIALAAGLGKAVKTAADFESGMSQVAAVSGATGDEFKALEARARELGGSTSFSAKEAAEGLQYLALAGWDTTQMIDGLEPVLHLAEAGALDLGRSADLVTDSMAGLGLGVEDLDGYLDQVAQTSRRSNTDIDALMEAFVIAGGTFDRLNVPLEEANSFLGVMANRGFKASEAGTAINAIMARLTQSAGPAADALNEMGVSAFDSEGNFRGMEVVMRDVEKSFSGMTEQERAHYQQQLAGLNHGKTFSAMLSGLGDEYDDLKASIIDSNGALLEMRNVMKDNLQGALENLSSAFEEILISVGTALIPVVKVLVGWLQSLADWFNGLSDSTKTTIAVVTAITAALALVAGPMLLLIGFIPQIIAGFTAIGVVTKAVTGALGLSTTAMYLKATAAKVLGIALKAMMGPIGWIIAGAVALTAAVIGVVKWFNRESKEAKRLAAEKDKLAETTDDLTDSIDESSSAYKDNQSEIKTNAKANEELAKKVQELADKENKSASEKALLSEYTKELNESVEGLNLAYDAEADALNLSSEQMQKRLDVFAGQESVNAGMERMTEITKEQIEAEKQLEEVNALREEYNQSLEDGSIKKGKYKKEVEELDEKERELAETLSNLGDEYVRVEEQVESSMDAVVESTEQAVESQEIAYENLSDSLQKTVDDMASTWQSYKDAATDMFDTLSDEAELTVDEMTKNLEENQRVIGEWADNIAKLAERGVDEGLLDKLREAGPESAGHVKALVNSSDGELSRLSDLFAKGGETATSALNKALGIEETDILKSVEHLVVDTEKSLRQQIKDADFENLGSEIPAGVEEGIYDGTDGAVNAVNDMATDMQDDFKSANEIKSPSRVYEGFGIDLVDGLVKGVDNSVRNAVSAMTKLAKDMLKEFNGIKAQFTAIGRDAMSGLRAGINAGRGSVMGVARGIANSVASTMRSALKIKSPSRVLMEIGRFTGEGLTDGLLGTQRMVAVAAERLAVAAVPDIDMSYATPTGIQSTLSSAINGTVDVNSREDLIAGAIANLERRLDGMQVVMEGETVGRIVAPTVSETINEGKNNSIRNGGRRRI